MLNPTELTNVVVQNTSSHALLKELRRRGVIERVSASHIVDGAVVTQCSNAELPKMKDAFFSGCSKSVGVMLLEKGILKATWAMHDDMSHRDREWVARVEMEVVKNA